MITILLWIVSALLTGLILFLAFCFAFIQWDQKNYVVPIMMYHSINYSEKPDALVTSPELFERHLAYLKKHKFEVLSLDQLVDGIKKSRKFSKKTAVITFDDGFEDNYTLGFPILKKYGYCATFFIPSGEIEKGRYMKWNQLMEMVASKMSIGSHALYVDSYLPAMKTEQLLEETGESKKDIERNLGITVKHFAYPIGGFNDEIKEILMKAGYLSASTTNRGFDQKNKDVFELNRVRFSDQDNRDYIMWMKLSGYNNFLRKPKRPN